MKLVNVFIFFNEKLQKIWFVKDFDILLDDQDLKSKL